MAYACPECGFEQDEEGRCPECDVDLEKEDEDDLITGGPEGEEAGKEGAGKGESWTEGDDKDDEGGELGEEGWDEKDFTGTDDGGGE